MQGIIHQLRANQYSVRILAHLARHYNREVPITGWPTDHLFNEFRDALDKKEQVAIIILDEIDNLVKKSGDDILYNLSRINSDLKHAKVSIIGISNDLTFTDYLDPRVKSSLGEEEIIFPRIMRTSSGTSWRRREARWPLKIKIAGGASHPALRCLCRPAGRRPQGAGPAPGIGRDRRADERDAYVREEHVRKAREKIEQDRITEVVRTLPTQSKLVLYSIVLLDRNNPGKELQHRRRLQCIPAAVPDDRRRCPHPAEGDRPDLGFGHAGDHLERYGRQQGPLRPHKKRISLSVPPEGTSKVLMDDYRLKALKDAPAVLYRAAEPVEGTSSSILCLLSLSLQDFPGPSTAI